MATLASLRTLLEHIHSYGNCSQILAETSELFDQPQGWFFRLLNNTIVSLIDDVDLFYGVSQDNPSPVLHEISLAAIHGIAAIELNDVEELNSAAEELSRLQKP